MSSATEREDIPGGPSGGEGLDPGTRDFYLEALAVVAGEDIPFLVGGAYALQRYTGIERHTKDFDIFVRPSDCARVLEAFAGAGYQTEMTHPHWLGKAFRGGDFIDVIFRSGNGVAEVDDDWFAHAEAGTALGRAVQLCPVEEMIWSKAFVQERERYDGADIAHLLLARAADLDWGRLLRRFDRHWRVLFAHLILFGFVYPSERARIPAWVLRELSGRLQGELDGSIAEVGLCQGTLLSREQYLMDIDRWGFRDARLTPEGVMTREQVAHWTAAIETRK